MQDNLAKQKSNIILRKAKNLAMAFIVMSDIVNLDKNLSQSINLDALDFFKDMSVSKDIGYLNEKLLSSIIRNINLLDSYTKLLYQQQKVSVSNYNIIHEHIKSIEQDVDVYKNNFVNRLGNYSDDQITLNKILKDNLGQESNKKDNLIIAQKDKVKDNNSSLNNSKDIKVQNFGKSLEITNRHEKIISELNNVESSSITELAKSFTNIASKTLQRDLNSLLLDGKIKVYGSRRWARYSVK